MKMPCRKSAFAFFCYLSPMSRRITQIVIAVATCLLVGFLSGYATQSSVDTWYADLNKPGFTPPNWLFGPVWTILYVLMGISAGMIWNRGFYHKWVKTALYHFGAQLLLNGLWSIVFFGFHRPFWALVVIVALLILLLFTIKWFRVVDRRASYILYPYLLWVVFASVLNFSIWQMN